jgi:hypothetical protein
LDLFEYKVIVGTESCHEAKLWRSENKEHPARDGTVRTPTDILQTREINDCGGLGVTKNHMASKRFRTFKQAHSLFAPLYTKHEQGQALESLTDGPGRLIGRHTC